MAGLCFMFALFVCLCFLSLILFCLLALFVCLFGLSLLLFVWLCLSPFLLCFPLLLCLFNPFSLALLLPTPVCFPLFYFFLSFIYTPVCFPLFLFFLSYILPFLALSCLFICLLLLQRLELLDGYLSLFDASGADTSGSKVQWQHKKTEPWKVTEEFPAGEDSKGETKTKGAAHWSANGL